MGVDRPSPRTRAATPATVSTTTTTAATTAAGRRRRSPPRPHFIRSPPNHRWKRVPDGYRRGLMGRAGLAQPGLGGIRSTRYAGVPAAAVEPGLGGVGGVRKHRRVETIAPVALRGRRGRSGEQGECRHRRRRLRTARDDGAWWVLSRTAEKVPPVVAPTGLVPVLPRYRPGIHRVDPRSGRPDTRDRGHRGPGTTDHRWRHPRALQTRPGRPRGLGRVPGRRRLRRTSGGCAVGRGPAGVLAQARPGVRHAAAAAPRPAGDPHLRRRVPPAPPRWRGGCPAVRPDGDARPGPAVPRRGRPSGVRRRRGARRCGGGTRSSTSGTGTPAGSRPSGSRACGSTRRS